MPFRRIVAKQMSDLLKALAHPHRLQTIEEIGQHELDVNTLQERLGISHSNVSQHLAILRAHRIVVERREGRFVYYRLRQPKLASWLIKGLPFLTSEPQLSEEMRLAIESATEVWTATANEKPVN